MMEIQSKKKIISNIISKINSNTFNKNDFYNFSKNNNVNIKKVKIENLNDSKHYDQNIVKQIYKYPEKKVIVVADMNL